MLVKCNSCGFESIEQKLKDCRICNSQLTPDNIIQDDD